MSRLAITFIVACLLVAVMPVYAQQPRPTRPAGVTQAKPSPTPAQARPERVMVALVFGQSNAANYGESRRTAGPKIQVLHNRKLARASDPLPGANGVGGSVWTRLGDKILAAGYYDRVIFVPAAYGGSEIADWQPEVKKHFKLIESAIDSTHGTGLRFTHLFWHQGESDNALDIGPAEYRARFLNIMRAIREAGVDAPVFVAVATRCGDYGENKDIRWAQRDVVNHDLRIWQGPDTDALGPAFRHDGCHFSTRGLDAHAELWLEYLARFETAKRPQP
jgi:hypothetical protein